MLKRRCNFLEEDYVSFMLMFFSGSFRLSSVFLNLYIFLIFPPFIYIFSLSILQEFTCFSLLCILHSSAFKISRLHLIGSVDRNYDYFVSCIPLLKSFYVIVEIPAFL